MSPPKLFSSDEVISALLRGGFRLARRSRGSHQALVKDVLGGGHRKVIVVLGKHQIPEGTFKEILRQAHLSYSEFLALARVKK